jgi:hypothetical protein
MPPRAPVLSRTDRGGLTAGGLACGSRMCGGLGCDGLTRRGLAFGGLTSSRSQDNPLPKGPKQ